MISANTMYIGCTSGLLLLTCSPSCSAVSQAEKYESPRLAKGKARRRRHRPIFEPAQYDAGFNSGSLHDKVLRVWVLFRVSKTWLPKRCLEDHFCPWANGAGLTVDFSFPDQKEANPSTPWKVKRTGIVLHNTFPIPLETNNAPSQDSLSGYGVFLEKQ